MGELTLNADQLELLDEIKNDEASHKATELLERALDHFNYTTTVLVEIAASLREQGDIDGADLLLEFSEEMAEHEAAIS